MEFKILILIGVNGPSLQEINPSLVLQFQNVTTRMSVKKQWIVDAGHTELYPRNPNANYVYFIEQY